MAATNDVKGGVYHFGLYVRNLETNAQIGNAWTIHSAANANKSLKYSGSMAAGFAIEA
jgi:hypothetical protein